MSGARALILGCGYVGRRLAGALAARGAEVVGTTRDPGRAAGIAASGASPVVADVDRPETLAPLVEWRPTVVFDLVRPQPAGEDRYSVEGTRSVARAFAGAPPEALVYVSSTSVYGRREGEWTDEDTPAHPSSSVGEARVEAERVYLDAWREHGLPVRICRAPGIYGPGRTLRERLELGAYRRLDDEELWVSRIHVDDLVSGLIAAWERGRPGATYLLCDDEPVTGAEYAELTAELLALPLPPAVSRDDIRQELSGSAFERRVGSRRCSNRRMREELGVVLRYPSVREGVPAALREEGAL
ncbi:MAG TPA: NAD-dependent epimerase/dehydratase family protein [Longimicrobiaceae bacterium]|nr:NAD-dependent epimerase/dehydratase family protein [Longimicrobiaceae bacterium]